MVDKVARGGAVLLDEELVLVQQRVVVLVVLFVGLALDGRLYRSQAAYREW